jgi:hypothetical protein
MHSIIGTEMIKVKQYTHQIEDYVAFAVQQDKSSFFEGFAGLCFASPDRSNVVS